MKKIPLILTLLALASLVPASANECHYFAEDAAEFQWIPPIEDHWWKIAVEIAIQEKAISQITEISREIHSEPVIGSINAALASQPFEAYHDCMGIPIHYTISWYFRDSRGKIINCQTTYFAVAYVACSKTKIDVIYFWVIEDLDQLEWINGTYSRNIEPDPLWF